MTKALAKSSSKEVKNVTDSVRTHLNAVERAREVYLAQIKRAESEYFDRIKRATEIITNGEQPTAATPDASPQTAAPPETPPS